MERQTKQYEVLERGTAVVRMEPRGEHGMEGFALADRIVFELVQQYRTDKKHYRVYPHYGDGWYDTCGPKIFNQYFTKEKSI